METDDLIPRQDIPLDQYDAAQVEAAKLVRENRFHPEVESLIEALSAAISPKQAKEVTREFLAGKQPSLPPFTIASNDGLC